MEKENVNTAIKIKFDVANRPEEPTLILVRRNGDKLGKINAVSIELSDSLNDAAEITFAINKYINGEKDYLWDEIVDFKLVYCPEFDKFFEIRVELDESIETQKTVFCTQLGQAELSQIMLYNIEINTEIDIEREEYDVNLPTVLFRPEGDGEDENYAKKYKNASLLHRIMEKCPHYKVIHVDSTVKNIQRTFSFDDTSVYDAMQEIAEEIHCLFVFHSNSDGNGNIQRTISVFDLEANCNICGHRGEFMDRCSECGSTDIDEGYGEDTMIFVTSDELAEDVRLTADVDAVKNCFKLEAGDDLMTATIRNCNPNGTDYIWNISDVFKEDMSDELVEKLESYDDVYEYYQKDCNINLDAEALKKYNDLADHYNSFITNTNVEYDGSLEHVPTTVIGYPALMNVYYNTVDFELYLRSGLMPSVSMSDTNAIQEGEKLAASLPQHEIAVSNINVISEATADNAVLSMARVLADKRYRITIDKGSEIVPLSDTYIWSGKIIVTSYSDETDTYTKQVDSVTITGKYEDFVKQKLEKSLSEEKDENAGIIELFELTCEENDDGVYIGEFVDELKKYSLKRLESFHSACDACMDIMIEQGIADDENTWADEDEETGNNDLYVKLYVPYYNKLKAIEAEIKVRSEEIAFISGTYDKSGYLTEYGLQNYIEDARNEIQSILDFERYLWIPMLDENGNEVLDEKGNVIYDKSLWEEFCSFRREDKYSNDNYISDGSDNAKLFKDALEFIEVATDEIYRASQPQYSISANLKNLLAIPKFSKIVDSFKVGNWLRIMVDDNVYKLRLIEYTIDYDDFDSISVEFSDVIKGRDSVSDIQDILAQATSMATSYDSVKRQAKQGNDSRDQLNSWVADGLSLTNMSIVGNAVNQNITWDSKGILCKEYLPITEDYDNRQLKIINRGLYVTDDGWKTSRAGIGNFLYYDPETKEQVEAYGVIADTLVGSLILSEKVKIYNEDNSISLDQNGFNMTIDKTVDSTNRGSFVIQNKVGEDQYEKIMYVDSEGNFVLSGGSVKLDMDDTNVTVVDGSIISAFGNFATHDDIQKAVDERKTIIRQSGDGIEIGVTDDPVSVKLNNKELGFYNNGEKVAWISDSLLYIENAIVRQDLRFGEFIWSSRETGNMGLRWVGSL